ncbi:MAG: hypothetical protein ABJ310_00300, partial [Roseobacter sp.]
FFSGPECTQRKTFHMSPARFNHSSKTTQISKKLDQELPMKAFALVHCFVAQAAPQATVSDGY